MPDRYEYVGQDWIINHIVCLKMINFIILNNLVLKEADHNILIFTEGLFALFLVLENRYFIQFLLITLFFYKFKPTLALNSTNP